jgi:hypothetical protein
MFLAARPRNKTYKLFPLLGKKFNPRRCALSGQTEKYQMAWPPPWMHGHKDFANPKKYPLEIDHINEANWDGRYANLRWLTRLHHIESNLWRHIGGKYQRKVLKGAPTRVSPNSGGTHGRI